MSLPHCIVALTGGTYEIEGALVFGPYDEDEAKALLEQWGKRHRRGYEVVELYVQPMEGLRCEAQLFGEGP